MVNEIVVIQRLLDHQQAEVVQCFQVIHVLQRVCRVRIDRKQNFRVTPPHLRDYVYIPTRFDLELDSLIAESEITIHTFEQVFEHIVDSSGGLVVLVDGAGRIRFASQAVIDLLGRRPEQIHGQSIAALVYQADLDRFRSLTDVRHPGDPQAAPVRARLRAADGRWRTLEWVISIPRSTDPGAAVLTGQEVGARIELPAELPPEPRRTPRDSLTDLPGS